MTEHQLQISCIAFFRNNITRKGLGIIIPVPNELARKRKDVPVCLGCSDTILLFKGRIVFCEFKVGKNNQQEIQVAFQEAVQELGYEYYVIKTIQDFENLLR